jgi:hypothetical protein
MLLIGLTISFLTVLKSAAAYSVGDVDPRALRGVWRLTSLDDEGLPFERNKRRGRGFFPPSPDPKTIWKLPMKEFTTYPKSKKSELDDGMNLSAPTPKKQTEIFIKIKDDHTFEQCQALRFSDGADEGNSLEETLELEVSKRERESFAWKGTWAFVDGNLILAADRPEKKPFSVYDDDDAKDGDGSAEVDTILVGKVAVQSEESLTENPALERRQNTPGDDDASLSSSSSQPRKGTIDVYLSIPRGKIKTGKFMYPKTHPVSHPYSANMIFPMAIPYPL